jgi:hypothetical protein
MFEVGLWVVVAVGAIIGLAVAVLALVFRGLPLWSYRAKDGRKVHGFFAWWATFTGVVVGLYVGILFVKMAGTWVSQFLSSIAA